MPDVYQRTSQNLAGVIPVDAAKITFAASGGTPFGVGMLTQSAQLNYQQQINRLYEIGTDNTYFIGGRTQGQASFARIIGPRAVQVGFYQKYGDMCQATSNTINLTAVGTQCAQDTGVSADGQGSTYTLRYCVITNIGISVGAQDMIVNENLQMLFVSLEVA